MRSVAVIIGTRPEAIKCAPVVRALRADIRFNPVVVSTGQHRQMLDETLKVFGIRPDVDLGIMTPGQSLSQTTYRVIRDLSAWMGAPSVDAVIVHGDTATTLAGALTGFHHQLPVVHVEAGLRSGNMYSPFPEEANRRLVGQIATLHLAPTPGNSANLIREGVSEERIVVTGIPLSMHFDGHSNSPPTAMAILPSTISPTIPGRLFSHRPIAGSHGGNRCLRSHRHSSTSPRTAMSASWCRSIAIRPCGK